MRMSDAVVHVPTNTDESVQSTLPASWREQGRPPGWAQPMAVSRYAIADNPNPAEAVSGRFGGGGT